MPNGLFVMIVSNLCCSMQLISHVCISPKQIGCDCVRFDDDLFGCLFHRIFVDQAVFKACGIVFGHDFVMHLNNTGISSMLLFFPYIFHALLPLNFLFTLLLVFTTANLMRQNLIIIIIQPFLFCCCYVQWTYSWSFDLQLLTQSYSYSIDMLFDHVSL